MSVNGKVLAGMVVICVQIAMAGCASRITTKNSVITTVCEARGPELIAALQDVVSGMKNYKVIPKTQDEVLVRYDPSNPLMGSATIQVQAEPASGLSKNGRLVTGIELVYTDVTPLLSQDTSFGGGDIIDRLKPAMNEYMRFKNIPCTLVRRQ